MGRSGEPLMSRQTALPHILMGGSDSRLVASSPKSKAEAAPPSEVYDLRKVR
jgi:hypothetical protein